MSQSDVLNEVTIVISKEALASGLIKLRTYGHDPNDKDLCLVCKHRDTCKEDPDLIVKPCAVPCG